jgi:hypothetical protein
MRVWSVSRWMLGVIVGPLLLGSCIDFNSLFKCSESSTQKLLPTDSFAPNGTIETAAPIVPELDATLNESVKSDFFKFDAKALERVRFTLTKKAGDLLSIQLEVVDLKGLSLADSGFFFPVYIDGPDRTNVVLEAAVPQDGQYVLKINGQYYGPPDSFCSYGQIAYHLSMARTGNLVDPVVTLQAITPLSVTFNWLTVDGATGYVIERQDVNKKWVQRLKLPATATSAVDEKSNTTYTYRIRAVLGAVSSPGTEIVVTPAK